LCALIDAFDTWALCKILRIPYTRHIRNADVRSVSGLLSNMAMERHLRFFGHIAHSAPDEDYHRAVAAAIHKPPSDWKRPPGRPNRMWLRAIESDLRPLNIGPSYAWKKAASREHYAQEEYAMKKNREGGYATTFHILHLGRVVLIKVPLLLGP